LISITIEGTQEAQAKLARIIPRMHSDQAQRVFLAIGRDIERTIESKQPAPESGRLKRATVTKGVSQTQLFQRGPAVFVLVKTRKGDISSARYAYGIEAGANARKAKPGGVMVFKNSTGQTIFTTRTKERPARPFFMPGFEQAGPRALNDAAEGLEKILMGMGR
jgi:hypothetical protein